MLSRTTYKRQAKDTAITKIRYILQEEDDEDIIPNEPIHVSAIESVVALTEPITEVPDKYDKIQLGFTIKFKSPYSFMKAIKDDSVKNILTSNIPTPKEKKEIRVVSVYNLRYRVFDKLNKDDKVKLVAYLQDSINKS